MKIKITILLISITAFTFGQAPTFTEKDIVITNWVAGTLTTPHTASKNTLAIIIAGSGPTNRNGNQNFLKSNNLKKLAEALTKKGISTFRYDKRIVKQIQQNNVDKNMLFDDFVTDAKRVVTYFQEKNNYTNIYIIGHSQGSLVGMLACEVGVTGFISLAGAGQNIGDVITEQVGKTAPYLVEDTKRVVGILKSGKTTKDYPPLLASLFNADLQKFMINWMQYEPQNIVKNLDIPVLIINGTKDLQVSTKEAELLKAAKPNAQLVLIKNMNHVLFNIEGGDLENSKSYNESFRSISPELVNSIVSFIN